MRMIERQREWIAALREAGNADEVYSVVDRCRDALGFEFYGVGVRFSEPGSPPRFVGHANWPSRLMERYAAEAFYRDDLVYRRCLETREPVGWDYLDRVRGAASYRRVHETIDAHGVRAGVTLIARLTCGGDVTLAMGVDKRRAYSRSAHVSRAAGSIALGLAEVGEALVRVENAQVLKSISSSERDCLYWTAAGKIAKQVAAIRGSSPGTVKKQLKSCKEKLSASTLSEAVCRAHRLGLFENQTWLP
ncbi:helix-turn-helix transcriptional regulator [Endothiovibrio diazotrophicus]